MKKILLVAVLAFVAVLTGCTTGQAQSVTTSAATAQPTSSAQPSPSPTSTPRPSGVRTTGSYRADLAAIGIIPDDFADYAKFMKDHICTTNSLARGIGVRGSVGLGSDQARDIQAVRLAVAYQCPTLTSLVESDLAYFGDAAKQ